MIRRDLEEAGADWIVQDCAEIAVSGIDTDDAHGALHLNLKL